MVLLYNSIKHELKEMEDILNKLVSEYGSNIPISEKMLSSIFVLSKYFLFYIISFTLNPLSYKANNNVISFNLHLSVTKILYIKHTEKSVKCYKSYRCNKIFSQVCSKANKYFSTFFL